MRRVSCDRGRHRVQQYQQTAATGIDHTGLGEHVQKPVGVRVGAVHQCAGGVPVDRDGVRVDDAEEEVFLRVRDLMSPMVEMATEETTAAEAFKVMLERHYRHLPVVDEQGRVLGILSIRNILEARIDDLLEELDSRKTI